MLPIRLEYDERHKIIFIFIDGYCTASWTIENAVSIKEKLDVLLENILKNQTGANDDDNL